MTSAVADHDVESNAWRDIRLPGWVDPEVVFLALFGHRDHAFWLDGGAGARAGVSYLGAPGADDRIIEVSSDGAGTRVRTGGSGAVTLDGRDVFDYLAASLDDAAPGSPGFGSPPPGFVGGWVGWFGYELGAREVGSPTRRSPYPDAAFMFVDRVVVFDHEAHAVSLRVRSDARGADSWVDSMAGDIERLASTPRQRPAVGRPTIAVLHRSREDYLGMLRACRTAIDNGDAYQICLTNEMRVRTTDDPLEVYRRLRRTNPSHHGGFIRFGAMSLLSSSPEQFLRITPAGEVVTRPIKGTRARSVDPAVDDEQRRALLASEKERAENVMIVDLMRNDLARTAVVGSVSVPDLFRVESYANVHQLVSTVTATLGDGFTPLDVVRTTLPAGSMSGAPKRSAMTILDRLEGRPRGLYSGTFGYVGVDGSVDLAMIIRSIVLSGGEATLGVGGGITTLSVDADEFDETILKAEPLLRALNARLVDDGADEGADDGADDGKEPA